LNSREIAALLTTFSPEAILLDVVSELVPGELVVAEKTFDGGEWGIYQWLGDERVVPGALVIEALAQAGALALVALDENRGRIAICAGANQTRFRRRVRDGETVSLQCRIYDQRLSIAHAHAIARVDGDVAVQSELIFAIR
jgi:3-hydroxyacyl-[acyl-carrier-protein] dehydratase